MGRATAHSCSGSKLARVPEPVIPVARSAPARARLTTIITAIEAMDVDVISLEASRSQMEILDELSGHGFTRAVGPGVYDVHSPRVPSLKEVSDLLSKALTAVGPDRLWVNPDCGLKTRAYAEVEPSLRNMVAAASALRDQLAQP